MKKVERLLADIRSCRVCEQHLPLGPRPIVRAAASARLLIVGQAPGVRVHETGIPWNDPSGDRLREWLGISREAFYDEKNIAIAPMGFCYPGKGKSGDLPPRPECAVHWREKLHGQLKNIRLTLLIGQYAQAWYLKDARQATLTETVKSWREYLPQGYLPLVHPSPRNRIWLRKNPWFERGLLPELRLLVRKALA